MKIVPNIFFVGIGGIGMSAIARYFVVNGKNVAGYDKTPTPITEALQEIGVAVHFDDAVENIPIEFLDKNNTLIVYTPAIPKDHKELVYFQENGFEILKRAQVLGKITTNTFCLAVAGTHGKTTTSSILGHIMQPLKATAFLGGIAENYNSNLILGEDKISVVEADEFDRSFLNLSPNIACITSTDADHLDIYGAHDALMDSFNAFATKVSDKLLVAKGIEMNNALTYAVNEDADYKAYNVKIVNGAYVFDVKTPTGSIKDIQFSLPGKHNMMNALAALAMANLHGVALEDIKSQLATFTGVQRRFSYKIKSDDIVLIDDYAHHPTEINAVEASVRELYPNKKVLAVFQPHLFSRTQDFVDDFAAALSKFDELLLLNIYPARELPIEGVTSDWLLSKVSSENKQLIEDEALVDSVLSSDAEIVVMLGAGDIGMMIDDVKKGLEKAHSLV